jgi:tRNA-dihydrouridine synthase B
VVVAAASTVPAWDGLDATSEETTDDVTDDLVSVELPLALLMAVKAAVAIPVVANGDIDSPQKAHHVLSVTGADAVMVGRAAQGRPWIFREIDHFLKHGVVLESPLVLDVKDWLMAHLLSHYELYGDDMGVRSARKHVGWYVKNLKGEEAFRNAFNRIDDRQAQMSSLAVFLDELSVDSPLWPGPKASVEVDPLP